GGIRSMMPPPPPPQVRSEPGEAPKKINASGGVLQGNALKRVNPAYPPIAKAAKASGAVQVQVTISEEGRVIDATAISGHPLLRDAALEAARQWEFKPTELSGVPVKVQGILTFNFTLQGEEANINNQNVSQASQAMKVRMPAYNSNTESLGKQTIEGVEAEGKRTVTTIPAGAIGNERSIEIVSETWYSPELQTTIMSKRNDPTSGETTYRLTNIRRGEPDASLFQVPSDYTVKEGGFGGGFGMGVGVGGGTFEAAPVIKKRTHNQ
ncbi:MAG: energy transducer TonB, partial [Blastocatellia bacterium]